MKQISQMPSSASGVDPLIPLNLVVVFKVVVEKYNKMKQLREFDLDTNYKIIQFEFNQKAVKNDS